MYHDAVHMQPNMSPPMAPLPPPLSSTPPTGPGVSPGNSWSDRSGGRYKADLCRNYLASGTCNFHGCVFAHGVEELRASRTGGSSFGMGSATGVSASPVSSHVMAVERLVEQLGAAVASELDGLRASQEANVRLEATLRRDQNGRRDDQASIDAWERHVAALRSAIIDHGATPIC